MMPPSSTQSDPSTGNPDLIVRGRRVITSAGEKAASIHIRDGRIAALKSFEDAHYGCLLYEAGEHVVMPGLVDTHVHINEPGRTEWEGFTTATRAAAAGGITTLVEMPLNSIPATTSVASFDRKLRAASGQLWVDTGFWGGAVPGNAKELRGLWEAGCFGFKCFLVESGVPEFARVSEDDLQIALAELAELNGPLLAHAELPGPIEHAMRHLVAGVSRKSHRTWLESRPRAAEDEAIDLLVRLAVETSVPIHIVHLSSSDAIPRIRRAKSSGVSVTVETCPHYLTFASEGIPDGSTQFKCAPPIREQENREALWEALRDGTVDFVTTDHSPCPPAMKSQETGDFFAAWGGIASLQLSLPAVWTEAKKRGFSFSDMAKWLCRGPARLAGLERKKGAIAPGYDADLAVWDPDTTFLVETSKLQHRHKVTPYAGRELIGIVEATFLRGARIYDRGSFQTAPAGKVLLRGRE